MIKHGFGRNIWYSVILVFELLTVSVGGSVIHIEDLAQKDD